jgi:aldehyde dehydrogenase (NAD+)
MPQDLATQTRALLANLGVDPARLDGGSLTVRSPITGETLAKVRKTSIAEADREIARAVQAFRAWRQAPAPRRGEFVRLLGQELRHAKADLGRLVSIEVGKTLSEGLGEVQEMIDICDFAVGLARQLQGLCLPSERRDHRLTEQWQPIGPVGVISSFNFPVAVWSWNAALAFVCGDSVIWKPSEKAPLTALAVSALAERARAAFGDEAPDGLAVLIVGDSDLGAALVDDARVPVISATGSTRMGRIVGERVARRFGRAILELGGNNASIVTPSADLDLTLRAAAFGAMGTAGQRCTTLRRLIVHESVYDTLVPKLAAVYAKIAIGDPLEEGNLIGPLIDAASMVAGASTSMAKAPSMPARRWSRWTSRPIASARRPSRRSSTCFATARLTRRSRSRTTCRRACPRPYSRPTSARSSSSFRPPAPIAASPT